METPERLLEKQHRVRRSRADRSVEIKTQDVRVSVLEAIFSRGDRRLGAFWRRLERSAA